MWIVVERNGVPSGPALTVPPEGLVLGRDPSCDVVLRDRLASRRHMRLRPEGAALRFEDLGSSSGVRVGGLRAGRGTLAPGDRVELGATVLRVLGDGDPALAPESILPAVAEDAPRRTEPAWKSFGAFMERLREAGDPKALLEDLMLGATELLGAERGFVLLRSRGREELVPVASHSIRDTKRFVAISRTITDRAIEERGTVFVADTLRDPWYVEHCGQTLLEQSRSIFCTPLGSAGRVFGVMYLDGPLGGRAPAEEDVPLLETVTAFASEILAGAETRTRLIETRGRLAAFKALAEKEERLVLGSSPASIELDRLVRAAAETDVTVLILGETGTGKERVARALHRLSPRKDGPFVPIHCAALPPELIEAELFGTEKGAYTGAAVARAGRFELAAGGTVFLDEIGEVPQDVQVKLLRVLQERQLVRIGASEAVPLDFRLVCATHRDLEKLVEAGAFRQDFYYRINVFPIQIRPLRERPEDLLPLIEYFLDLHSARFGRRKPLSPEALELLRGHDWPGNVRELQNAIERALVVETGETIRPSSLPIVGGAAAAGGSGRAFWEDLPDDYEAALEIFERGFLAQSLRRHGGNVSAVARAWGKTRNAIYRRMKRLDMMDGAEGGEDGEA